MDVEEFRKHAHQLVDWVADYMADVRDYPVRAQVLPGDIAARIPPQPPEKPEAFEAIFDDFQQIILPGITHWQHPRFFAYFPANVTPPSQLADMLISALGVNAMLWETSPAATELEESMIRWLLDLMDLPRDWSGVIQDTASTAIFCAVLVARERATGWRVNDIGYRRGEAIAVYTSKETHSSLEKAVRMAGLGKASIRFIPTDASHAMDPQALAVRIEKDVRQGIKPALVVASIGATGIGASDNLREIGSIAREKGIYFHVDGAWAGSAMVCPEYRPLIDGIDLADSYCFNPHKWMGVGFDCSAHFVRDSDSLIRTLTILPEYLKTREGTTVTDFRDWGPQLGRRNRALKLWFVLRSYGVEGLQAMIRRHVSLAAGLAETIRQSDGFELVTQPRLSLFTFRFKPSGVSAAEADRLTEILLQAINDDGFTYLTRTVVGGRPVIRWQVGQTDTRREDVTASWARTQALAVEVLSKV